MSRRPVARAVVAASLAFGLVAAAASGTAFSVNSVEGIAVASSASGSFDVQPCDGAFDVTWTVVSGEIVGVRAVRVAPSSLSDPGLKYCADMPYAILVADRDDVEFPSGSGEFDLGHASWVVEWTGVTDASTGSIDASSTEPVSGPLQLAVGTAVQLAIGPDPLSLTFAGGVPVTPAGDCESLASGGTSSAVSIDGDEFCVYVFDTAGTETFEVLDARVMEVDYLVVGGGGGGAGRDIGGGGGAGGVLVGAASVSVGVSYPVVVGDGGAGGGNDERAGSAGESSTVFGVTALGGGGAGGWTFPAGSGGSGGGGPGAASRDLDDDPPPDLSGGAGTPGQGNDGGAGQAIGEDWYGGGGGGGAGAPGSDAFDGRHGGDGVDVSATFGAGVGVDGSVGGGGGGAGHRRTGDSTLGRGGDGGGGSAGISSGGIGVPGTGGGGGASRGSGATFIGGKGGSGVVTVRLLAPR